MVHACGGPSSPEIKTVIEDLLAVARAEPA
jgi:hypothetical protein